MSALLEGTAQLYRIKIKVYFLKIQQIEIKSFIFFYS